ncbi:MAG: hypothetical protein HOO96_31075 [Polyangiaceae bacterium]|nr:hypothetical protein [Polyangiaceae bacterium]
MKLTIIAPLFVGLLATGCAATTTEGDEGATGQTEGELSLSDRLGISRGGSVQVDVLPFMTLATASFTRGQGPSCKTSFPTLNCELVECGSDAFAPTDGHAGVITISGGKNPVTLTPEADGYYSEFLDFNTPGAPFFAAGAPITVSAAGGSAIGPFSVSGLSVPGALVVSSLAKDADGNLLPPTIDRSQRLALTWQAANANAVEVVISSSEGWFSTTIDGQFDATSNKTLSCVFPGASGGGVIPASALAKFTAGSTTEITPDVYHGKVDARLGYFHVTPQNRKAVLQRVPGTLKPRAVDVVVQAQQTGAQVSQLTFR